jgi:acyl transferase domain-containing protein
MLGEGAGLVVLKRREEAERDGDRIYALIKGVGVSSDGRGAALMAPRLEGEVLALRRAYEMAGISPRTIELIEAHGTGTTMGDPTEIRALREVFGSREGEDAPTCALGAVKSMIGHTLPAAGAAGLIKAALALHHRILPPTLHCDEPNPALELEKTPFFINTETRPWVHGQTDYPRRAGVNAFGFGGINSHVILEEHLGAETRSER